MLTGGDGSAVADSGAVHDLDLNAIVKRLSRYDLDLTADMDTVRLSDPKTGGRFVLKQVRNRGLIEDGNLHSELVASLNGGVVTVEVEGDLGADEPMLQMQMESRDLIVDEAITPLVESEFPGLDAQAA